MIETITDDVMQERISRAEQESSERMQPIRDLIDRVSKNLATEDREVLKALLDCTDRYIFLAAWIRAKLDTKAEGDLLAGLKEMFDEGEDDFETYIKPLAHVYDAVKVVEKLYSE